MAIYQIPVRNDIPAYSMRVDLDGKVYILGFRFNGRLNRWVMDVSTSEADPIVMGITLLINQDLLGRFKDERLPAGTFFAVDLKSEGRNPTLDDFGKDVVLVYESV